MLIVYVLQILLFSLQITFLTLVYLVLLLDQFDTIPIVLYLITVLIFYQFSEVFCLQYTATFLTMTPPRRSRFLIVLQALLFKFLIFVTNSIEFNINSPSKLYCVSNKACSLKDDRCLLNPP